ncbi:MAG: REP element-mobilizing transposase RayT [Bradymonadia bacterium]|jgi:REP element-mobilizing transposase RayT
MATPARQIEAGQIFEVTARCINRRFFLPPRAEVTEAFLFILAYYAQRHGISLYALVIMANHFHLLGRDNRGNLPHFMRDLNSFVARCLNSQHNRDDKLWSGDGYHVVRPVNPEDMWARLMYITSNPVNADLVSRTEDYPGFVTTPSLIGKTLTFHRPAFYREDGKMPETASLTFEIPPTLEMTRAQYVERFRDELRVAEFEAKRCRKLAGKGVVGAERLRAVEMGSLPRSGETWFQPKGDFACACENDREAACAGRRAFLDEYALCRSIWREDQAGVVFPPGTWWVREYAGAEVRGAPG